LGGFLRDALAQPLEVTVHSVTAAEPL